MNIQTYNLTLLSIPIAMLLLFTNSHVFADTATSTTSMSTTSPSIVITSSNSTTTEPVVVPSATTTHGSTTTTSSATTTSIDISPESTSTLPVVTPTSTSRLSVISTSTSTVSTTLNTVTTPSTSTTTPNTVFIDIRAGDTIVFSSEVTFPSSTTPSVLVSPTGSTSTIPIAANSLLATLTTLDASTTTFEITNLSYYGSFDSFLISCIAIPSEPTTPYCYNWTYAVNGTFPFFGVDDYLLKTGDTVHLFFGPQRKTILSTSTMTSGESFTATAQHYDLNGGTYIPSPNVTIGVGTSNPDFTFSELVTATSDSNGEARFTLTATGTFAVGIKEDFYFPSVSITIMDTTTASSPPMQNATSTPPNTGGGGSYHNPSPTAFDVQRAVAFLTDVQNSDGSFDAPLYTDWVAIAFAASNPGSSKAKLRTYLEHANYSFPSVTDYERHAMALLALGINPYSDTPTDYITPIVEAFDGTQIGNPSFDNDDIFALFPLLHTGYSGSDEIIQKITAFILSTQKSNGSWDESADMTAAAMQALEPLYILPGVTVSTARASDYLTSTQQADGGWGNIDSTSWVLTAINATNEVPPSHPGTWVSSTGFGPADALTASQQNDGGVRTVSESDNMRVWSTSYAITAAAGKNWVSLLKSFPQPVFPIDTSDGSSTYNHIPLTATSSEQVTHIEPLPQVFGHATGTLMSTTQKSTPFQTVEASFTFSSELYTTQTNTYDTKKANPITPSTQAEPVSYLSNDQLPDTETQVHNRQNATVTPSLQSTIRQRATISLVIILILGMFYIIHLKKNSV